MSTRTLRRRAIMRAAEGGLPSEYQQVEWVGHSGYAEIETNFIPTPNSSMYARFAAEGTQGKTNYLGARDATTGADKAFLIVSFSSAHKIGFFRWGSSVQCIAYDTDYHDYELTPTSSKIDGISYTMNAPITTQTNSISIRIFGEWNGSIWQQAANIRLASMSLWENGAKQLDFIPCYRKSDDVIGLYDTVSGTFFTKSTSSWGRLTKGANI